MSNWIDKDGRRHVGVMVGGKRVHRILPEGATAGDAKLAESAIRASIGNGRVVNIPGDPPLASVMGLYIEHAKNLRSSDTAIHHANRLGPWVSMYRASQVRECAAHIVKDMTTKAVQADGTLRAPYTAATVNRSLGTLKKALAIAHGSATLPPRTTACASNACPRKINARFFCQSMRCAGLHSIAPSRYRRRSGAPCSQVRAEVRSARSKHSTSTPIT